MAVQNDSSRSGHSIRKLCYSGWDEYCKGDGRSVKLASEEDSEMPPCLKSVSMGRAKTGSRQDGPMECCPTIFAMLPFIRKYVHDAVQLTSNILWLAIQLGSIWMTWLLLIMIYVSRLLSVSFFSGFGYFSVVVLCYKGWFLVNIGIFWRYRGIFGLNTGYFVLK